MSEENYITYETAVNAITSGAPISAEYAAQCERFVILVTDMNCFVASLRADILAEMKKAGFGSKNYTELVKKYKIADKCDAREDMMVRLGENGESFLKAKAHGAVYELYNRTINEKSGKKVFGRI